MGRWAQHDEDEERLPEGMRRTGYDADSQVYTYEDEDGTLWEGAPGARYGQLRRVGEQYTPDESYVYQPSRRKMMGDDWRYLAPFFLLICLFLLGVYYMLGGGSMIWGGNGDSGRIACGKGQAAYTVSPGDSCWSIARNRDIEVKELLKMNKKIDCDKLQIGSQLCIPE